MLTFRFVLLAVVRPLGAVLVVLTAFGRSAAKTCGLLGGVTLFVIATAARVPWSIEGYAW